MTIVGLVFYVFMGTDFQPPVSLLRQDVALANRHLAWNGVRVRLLPAPGASAASGVARPELGKAVALAYRGSLEANPANAADA